jgi:tRNA threonylcarbamoyladenosine biosynthesis protein TsaE
MEFSRHEIEKYCQEIKKSYATKRIFLLYGEIGAGKTTFVRKFLSNEEVTSPTFNFCHQYDEIFHFDLYRLNCSKINLENIGFFDAIFYEKKIFVEWAENLPEEIFEKYLKIFQKEILKIQFTENKILIQGL